MSCDPGTPTFDAYAEGYEATLQRGLALAGRTRRTSRASASLWLATPRAAAALVHYDPRLRLRDRVDDPLPPRAPWRAAPRRHGQFAGVAGGRPPRARLAPGAFVPLTEPIEDGSVDVAYCNGVFHHIAPDERPRRSRRSGALRPGGVFALFENNPWNPGTRLVMCGSRRPRGRHANAAGRTPDGPRRGLRARRDRLPLLLPARAARAAAARAPPGQDPARRPVPGAGCAGALTRTQWGLRNPRAWVHGRRARVISAGLADLLPDEGTVLDIGCGDCYIDALVMKQRPGLQITGMDVGVRGGRTSRCERSTVRRSRSTTTRSTSR